MQSLRSLVGDEGCLMFTGLVVPTCDHKKKIYPKEGVVRGQISRDVLQRRKR